MTTLYDLKEEYLCLLNELQEEGIDNETALSLINQTKGEIKDKAKNIGYVIKNLGSDAEAIDAEIKRLQDKKKAVQNKEARLKDLLLYVMTELNIKGFKDPVLSISRRVNSQPSIYVIDESLIPEKYLVTKVEKRIDKKAIAQDYDNSPIEGVTVIKGEHIRIN